MIAAARAFRPSNPLWLAGLVATVLVLGLAPARAQSAAPSYADLVAQAESGDPATDFTALRNAYVVSAHYDGYGMKTLGMYDFLGPAFQAKDCAKVVATSDQVLKIDYTPVTVHFMRTDCFKQMGDQARSDLERAIGRGLARSLLGSGDGKSTVTAYVVVTMAEERFVLSFLELNVERQALLGDGGHKFDLIEGKNGKTGEKASVYFNIDAVFGSLTRALRKAR